MTEYFCNQSCYLLIVFHQTNVQIFLFLFHRISLAINIAKFFFLWKSFFFLMYKFPADSVFPLKEYAEEL